MIPSYCNDSWNAVLNYFSKVNTFLPDALKNNFFDNSYLSSRSTESFEITLLSELHFFSISFDVKYFVPFHHAGTFLSSI